MTLNGVMAVTLRYFTEFGKPAFQHIIASARIELIDIVVRVRCHRKESSRLLSHLLMSFLSRDSDRYQSISDLAKYRKRGQLCRFLPASKTPSASEVS